jgi:lipoprotein-releasing system permease protein
VPNLKTDIARRYLFSKKSSNAINLITGVSTIGIGIGTAALILVLSVFNGLTQFIEGLFASVDPEIKVVASVGKTFEDRPALLDSIEAHPDVVEATRTLEGRVWLAYQDRQAFATLKGVEPDFTAVNPLEKDVFGGEYTFAPRNGVTQAVLGNIIAHNLSANTDDETHPIRVSYLPQDASTRSLDADARIERLFPAGYFSIQKEYDEKYVFTDFSFVQRFFGSENRVSAYELRLSDIDRAKAVQADLQSMLGDAYEVQTWYEQHATLYRVMQNEKFISYLILVLMLSILAINIVGGLSMIVLDKTKDIAVLKSMGATSTLVRRVFEYVGLLVGGIGGGIGVLIALLLGLGQKYLGLITLQGGDSFRVKAFPIELQVGDFVLVFATVMVLSGLASLYPAIQAARIQVVEGLRQ